MSPTPHINPRPSSGRLQAASERIRARRRRSERTLWLVAALFCVAGLGTTYAAYVDAQPKQVVLPKPPEDRVEPAPVIEISHAWDAREQRWRMHQQELRRIGDQDYEPETRRRASDILEEVRDILVELAMAGRSGSEVRRCTARLEEKEAEWSAFLKNLPRRRTFPR